MSALPDTITVCSQRVRIIQEDPGQWSDPDTVGRVDSHRGAIHLRADCCPGMKCQTIIHEVVHLVAMLYGLYALNDDETAINCLSVAILGLIRDNPALIASLQDPAAERTSPCHSGD